MNIIGFLSKSMEIGYSYETSWKLLQKAFELSFNFDIQNDNFENILKEYFILLKEKNND